TSLAVVYAVLVETGLNRSIIGKRIMSATFVTDILTLIGLSVLFITPNLWILPFVAASLAVILGLPRLAPWFVGRYGDRVIEPEIRLRGALRPDVTRRAREQPGGAAGVRAGPGNELALHGASQRAGADAGRRVRLSDAVLLPQGRTQRLAARSVGQPGRARAPRRGEDGARARRGLPARAP